MAGGGGKRGRPTGAVGGFITKDAKGTKNTKGACPSRRDTQVLTETGMAASRKANRPLRAVRDEPARSGL